MLIQEPVHLRFESHRNCTRYFINGRAGTIWNRNLKKFCLSRHIRSIPTPKR
jgi:hypothetical protein